MYQVNPVLDLGTWYMVPIPKLLIVTSIFPPDIGGPATYVSTLVKRLPKSIEATVVTFVDSKQPVEGSKEAKMTKKGISNHPAFIIKIPITQSSVARQFKLFFTVFNQLKSHDLVYVQGTLTVGFAALLACWLRRKPYITKFVGDEVWEAYQRSGGTLLWEEWLATTNQRKTRWLQKIILQRAQTVIVPGKWMVYVLQEYYGVEAKWVHNAVEVTPRINNELRIKAIKKKKKLVYIGRLVAWKHVDEIIEALRLLNLRSNQAWYLDIVGTGPELPGLKIQVSKSKMNPYITFHGNVPGNQVLSMIHHSFFLILYSSYEGLSHTLLDAMALKTKIIASNITANREVLAAGKYGRLVPLNNPDALAQAIQKRYADTTVEAAYKQVNKQYSWEQHLKKLMKVVHDAYSHA